VPAFLEAALAHIERMAAGWSAPRYRKQGESLLKRYCAPIAEVPVDQVDTEAVLKVLMAPHERGGKLWSTIGANASKLRGLIERVLDAEKALGHITAPHWSNPARWRGHLAQLLAKTKPTVSHRALVYAEAPGLMADLLSIARTPEDSAVIIACAMAWQMATGVRPGNEALGARWSEIDRRAKLWVIPAARMKMAKAHRVPLSDLAIEILDLVPRTSDSELLFPGLRGQQMHVKNFGRLLQRLGRWQSTTAHGMRSMFRDWAGEETVTPYDVAEAALAHQVGDESSRAYRRGDSFKKRVVLMEQWGAYLSAPQDTEQTTVASAAPGMPALVNDNVTSIPQRA
jgi:integrase